MSAMLDATLLILAIVILLTINAVGILLVALQLPGTWLMIAATAVFAWWRWDAHSFTYGWWTLAILLLLAALGELVEFAASALGSQAVGGSKRGAALSIVIAIVGAIVGSFLIPIPIVGTLLGAAIGAGTGAALGDKWAGRSWSETTQVFKGAALGKLGGAVGKLAIAAAMWLVTAVALFL